MIRVLIIKPDPEGAPHIHEVHLHHEGARHFFASFNLTEFDEGRTLKVSMFSARDGSPPPGVHWFREFAAEHFPRGEVVTGARLETNGTLRPWTYRFKRGFVERAASAALVGAGVVR